MNCDCPVVMPGPSLGTSGSCGGGIFVLFMAMLEQFLKDQCDVHDPCGQIRPREVPDATYDFIIAGGGSAGSVVASRLSEVPEWKVLLVEAGVNEPVGSQVPSMFVNFLGSSIDWKYHTEPEKKACLNSKEHKCYWPRGKVIGGTSVLHGMMYMRGSRKDYDDWEALGNKGWSYKDVLPYFKKSENNLQADKMDKGYHGVGGMLPVSQFPYAPPMAEAILQGAQELGQRVGDVNGKFHEGFAIAQATNRDGIRYSASRAFLRPVKDRPNLHIMLNTTVSRVLVDPTIKRAIGVEVIKPDGSKHKINIKKEVVVSGGAVNSPQILQLSGIGPRDELAKVNVPVVHDLPGVGKNLHNHVAFRVSFHINDTATYALNWVTAMQYMTKRDGLLSGTGLSSTTGLIKTKFADKNEDHPDAQIFFGGYLANCAKTGELEEKMSPVKEHDKPPKRVVTMTPTTLHPKSRGYLTLKSNDPLSHPKIVGNYLTAKYDVDVLIEAVKFCVKLSETTALQRYGMELIKTPEKGCEDKKFGSDEYWECAIRRNTAPENHQAGSCKMGPSSDPEAVVDPQLRVHGVPNIRVMDVSIMPKVTSGNTAAPAYMIAEKGTDMIKKLWLKQ